MYLIPEVKSGQMELKIDHYSRVPLHIQVEQLLRTLIQKEEYQQGALLPREIELATKLGISRNTIRQATNKLEYEGLLIRKKGVGTRVANSAITTRLNEWHSFTQEMNAQGIVFTNHRIQVEETAANPKIAQFFQIKEGTPILKLNRLRGDADGPFVYFESYFHPRIGLSTQEDFSRPLYDILEKDYQIQPALSKEHIRAALPTPSIARLLYIKTKDPVLVRERYVLDAQHLPVEYNIGFYHAEKFTYSIDIMRS